MFWTLLQGVCVSSCGENLVLPTSYAPVPTEENPCPKAQKRSCCVKKFAFVLCDADSIPTSLSDPEAIALLKTNHKMMTFSNASVTFNVPTENTFDLPCGDKLLVSKTQLIDIEVFVVAEDHTDETFWRDVCLLNNKLGFIGQYTDNYTILSDDWIDAFINGDAVLPVTQMAIPFSFTISPYLVPFAKNEPCRWKMQIEIPIECTLRSALMPGFVGQLET